MSDKDAESTEGGDDKSVKSPRFCRDTIFTIMVIAAILLLVAIILAIALLIVILVFAIIEHTDNSVTALNEFRQYVQDGRIVLWMYRDDEGKSILLSESIYLQYNEWFKSTNYHHDKCSRSARHRVEFEMSDLLGCAKQVSVHGSYTRAFDVPVEYTDLQTGEQVRVTTRPAIMQFDVCQKLQEFAVDPKGPVVNSTD